MATATATYPTPLSTTAQTDFPTPIEAAQHGLNPNPAPVETGLSALPTLTGKNATTHAQRQNPKTQIHRHQPPKEKKRDEAPATRSSKSAEHVLTRALDRIQTPEVKGAFDDGKQTGEYVVGYALETVVGVCVTAAEKVKEVVEYYREGGLLR
ncbi:uncharacterized protein SPPG_03636 [Spizellomyces punctatus DAOM BR117]|uniref:Uncharacterized protein n=1 Tax=Spizellomyces punctatus (strain DAOM BR117) TaxID=645134 RepID=A0A0L0HK57_SPIPD|nr:uncharacterized protein SPPG_03636 [Spizellomyces punctatus DAOM BR117]KND01846.1 hypothetical protein SPPG_03636 [Spizellomyces punctatus DAOM BR117]|eukprot:XP_016609885.1 hypothetical protein SPPG_03636 [Spizellomyces punctatus DAOM BR117]